MTDHRIEPVDIVDMVERYISHELDDAVKYTNREPLDESGVYSLHCLAAEVYALGVQAGERAERSRGRHSRERARARAIAEQDKPKPVTE